MSPRMSAPSGFKYPQAGVIATAPAIAPEATPSVVALPSRFFSYAIHVIAAAAVEI
ncbi:unannotated protein [freshwater metagenome]|uniref:Unannotated protein n=1 Tax=freshwater metagenome TaxID=449393 RepID=A0A6J5YTH2_9ZZZZ